MTDRIIQVRHPATICQGDDDGTGRDVSWLACSTSVRLHERDPASFRLVQRRAKPCWDMPYEVYACDGKLWGRLDGRNPFAPNEPCVGVEHLVAFLEGRPCDHAQRNELEWALAGTPVLACDGHDLQPGRIRRRRPHMPAADRARATADVTAFVESNVAICDGRVMVGGHGLLVSRYPGQFAHHRDSEWEIMPWRGYRPGPGRTYRPGDLAEAVAFESEATGDANLPPGVLDDVWLADDHEAGDGDIVETINELPRTIRATVRRRVLGRIPVAERVEAVQSDGGILADAMRRLSPWYARASTGTLGLDDAAAAISACESVVNALNSVIPHERARLQLDEIEVVIRSYRQRMVPRIHARLDGGNELDMASLLALS